MFQDKILALSDFAFEPDSPGFIKAHSRLLQWYLFGMSGWWSSNAIFSQLPIFVSRLPAGERLGNQLSTTLQLGNAFLITYKVLEKLGFHFDVRKVINAMMLVACASLIASVFLWDKILAGMSVPLLIVMGFAGAVGCMSNSIYWAFMISHPARCTKAASVGMCLSGVVTSMMQALQMAGRGDSEPRFSVGVYLAMAAALQMVWGLVVLNVESARRRRKYSAVRDPWHGQLSTAAVDLLNCDSGSFKPQVSGSDYCEERRPRINSDGLSDGWPDDLQVRILNGLDFLLHAGEYTMPTLLPFIAASYTKAEEQELLVRMMVVQQWGETLGRLVSPDLSSRHYYLITGLCAVSMPSIFVLSLAAALRPQVLASTLPFVVATWALPAINFWFNLCYGLLQNVLFLIARHLTESVAVAERLASTMGFVGQMGSLSANLIACWIVNA